MQILLKNNVSIFRNPYFWALIFLIVCVVVIYQAWPWREYQFTEGVWQYFSWLSSLGNVALFEIRYKFYGILFLIPIVYSSLLFKWKGALIVTILSLVYILSFIGSYASFDSIIINSSLILLPSALFTAISTAIELSRNYKQQAEERRLYLLRLLEAQENERRRLSQELHDDTIQNFLLIDKLAKRTLIDRDNAENLKNNAESISEVSTRAIEDLRRICLDLRPYILDEMGLIPALRWLVGCMNEEYKIPTSMEVEGSIKKVSPQVEATIFRLIQEALNNIIYHAKAKNAIIKLAFDAKSLNIAIKDDGEGFIMPKKLSGLLTEGKFGLLGIQERIKLLGGNFEIRSKPNDGTLLIISIPC